MVIINDGSTDSTEQIVEQYRTQHPEKIILKSIENGGLANARNTAFPLCSGDFYVNLDADDYLESDTFEKAIACFNENENADVCFYGYKSFDENGKFFGSYSEDKQYLDEPVDGLTAFKLRIQRKIWICQGNAIYRMSLIKDNNIVNHAGKNQGEDMYFISRCLLAARKVVCFKGDNFCCMERTDSMNRAKFNTSFFQTVQLLEQLTEDIKRDYPKTRDEILPFIYSEKVTQNI
jgi:glycosyltransferase involved in cell wall biosynthesis